MVKHINHALVPKAHTPIYLMHKYWARKPHNVVRKYIECYSKEGEIVLDPFCGSGVTAIEALRVNRKAIAIDLDPIATFISRMTAMPVDIEAFERSFDQIKKNCADLIKKLYETKCQECDGNAQIICTHWKNDTPIKIMYECKKCNKIEGKGPTKDDLKRIEAIEESKIPYWYPKKKLYYNARPFMKKEKRDWIHELFTKRNLIALSILYNEIEQIDNPGIRDLMKFAFTSMTHLASMMTPVRSTRPLSSFWPVHSYWVPPIFMESNVWNLFKSAFDGRQGVLKGKRETNEILLKYIPARNFEDFDERNANSLIKTHNALELSELIPRNSVDYVFTDPPYGGSVQYLELSTMWASWLRMNLDYDDEITINNCQNKDFEYYHKMMAAAFREIYRVLKPGKYLTVTFHNTSIRVWNSIIKAAIQGGFTLQKIIFQPPPRPSAKGLLQPYGSAVGDYYIRFKKPDRKIPLTEAEIDEKRYEKIVVNVAKKILAERAEPTMYQYLLSSIFPELRRSGALLSGEKDIDEIMKAQVGKEFVLVNIKNEEGKVVGQKWWLKDPSSIPYYSRVPLTDRVETAVIDVLNRKIKASFDDVLQEIFIKFPNALTPDTQRIKEVLAEYAEKTRDRKWRLKQTLEESKSYHTEMIYYLANLGKKSDCNVWVGSREQREVYGKQLLSELCSETTPKLSLDSDSLARIKQIDVLWYKDGKIEYEFEVENTTGITEAIVRGSNIPYDTVKRFIVIPEQRQRLLHRKLEEPILRENVEKNHWDFIFYKDLRGFYEDNKRKKSIEASSIDSITRQPKLKPYEQVSLSKF